MMRKILTMIRNGEFGLAGMALIVTFVRSVRRFEDFSAIFAALWIIWIFVLGMGVYYSHAKFGWMIGLGVVIPLILFAVLLTLSHYCVAPFWNRLVSYLSRIALPNIEERIEDVLETYGTIEKEVTEYEEKPKRKAKRQPEDDESIPLGELMKGQKKRQ